MYYNIRARIIDCIRQVRRRRRLKHSWLVYIYIYLKSGRPACASRSRFARPVKASAGCACGLREKNTILRSQCSCTRTTTAIIIQPWPISHGQDRARVCSRPRGKFGRRWDCGSCTRLTAAADRYAALRSCVSIWGGPPHPYQTTADNLFRSGDVGRTAYG